ncbi:MAG: GNAT family N-acetyltransferase [Halanaeroarchaeum sp.]
MYVRDAKNREEVWLLDRLEDFGFEDPAFRSRDYVIALDEEAGRKVGFGRVRIHSGDDGFCEITCVGVLPEWRGGGVGSRIVERLVERARDEGCGAVYAFTPAADYLEQFGFAVVDEDALDERKRDRLSAVRETTDEAVALRVDVSAFDVPTRLERRFAGEERDDPEESAEDFGIDPDTATYKYDTGR